MWHGLSHLLPEPPAHHHPWRWGLVSKRQNSQYSGRFPVLGLTINIYLLRVMSRDVGGFNAHLDFLHTHIVTGIAQVAVMTQVRLCWLERSWRRARRKQRWLLQVHLARGTGERWEISLLHTNCVFVLLCVKYQTQTTCSFCREWPVSVEPNSAPSSRLTTTGPFLVSL